MAHGFGLTEKENTGAGDATAEGELGFFEKSGVIPCADRRGRDAIRVLSEIGFAGADESLRGEIGERGFVADDGGPVFGDGLGADFVELGDGEAGEAFAVAGVVVGLTTDGDAARSGWNLKEDDAETIRGNEFVNLAEGRGGSQASAICCFKLWRRSFSGR